MNSAFDWAAIAVAALSLAGSVILAIMNRRKTRAEAADVITDAATSLVKNLDERVRTQQERIKALECAEMDNKRRIDELSRLGEEQQRQITDLRAGVRLLTSQVRTLGSNPVWVPADSRNE